MKVNELVKQQNGKKAPQMHHRYGPSDLHAIFIDFWSHVIALCAEDTIELLENWYLP